MRTTKKPVIDDLVTGEWLSPREAGKLIGVGPDSIRSWIEVGRRVGGRVIRLKGYWVGRWRLTRLWLMEFLDAVTAAKIAPPESGTAEVEPETPETIRQEQEAVRRRLNGGRP